MSGRTARRRVIRIRLPDEPGAAELTERADLLATEEPLGIRVAGEALTMTMRTPGDDVDLAAGFLVSEGIVRHADDIASIRLCDGTTCGHAGHDGLGNIVDVELRPGLSVASTSRRNFMTTSACGVCGKASSAELFVHQIWDLNKDRASITAARLATMSDALRDAQRVFASTGGLHAAGVFAADGGLIAAREDVGRHNAVDKVVGWALRNGKLPMSGCILLVSGRASYELVQKAVLAGFPVLAAVSAPSSLAAELAEEAGLTLVGFLRGGSMNVYTRPERVLAVAAAAT
ncbi:MAG TPA: formate dehydrogenase accessory sulfurtransferase FdhD [Streptosporangiaceae bacterium]|nr:formate dehydrogenase accessory sulfurtransferase FdhD [Streptosporangiaceae bacterium]